MVSTKYRKMKAGCAMIRYLQMRQDKLEHAARHSSTLFQPKREFGCARIGDLQMRQDKLEHAARHSSTLFQPKREFVCMMIGDLQMRQDKLEHAARQSSTLFQPKQEHAATHYSTSEEIISRINKDTSELMELVDALKADDADTFSNVVKSISEEHKLPPKAIIQGIQISGDTLIHTAARHKAEETLDLICEACPPLLTAQNWVGDTVWHVVATEGLNPLFRQLRAFRQEQLSTPTTYNKAGDNGQHLRLNSLNNEGNTALHASLISCNESIADELFEMTPAHESWCYFLPNKEGKSAIYLAAEAEYVNLLRQMMKVAAAHPWSLSETLKGKSIIHATMKHLVSLDIIMESLDIIMEVAPELFHSRDEKGMTPLQWAASSGCSPEVFAYLKAKLART